MSARHRRPWFVGAALLALVGCTSYHERPFGREPIVGVVSLTSSAGVAVRLRASADVVLLWAVSPPSEARQREVERLACDPRRVGVEIVTYHVGDVPLDRVASSLRWNEAVGRSASATTEYPAPLHVGRDDIRMVLVTVDGASYRFPVP